MTKKATSMLYTVIGAVVLVFATWWGTMKYIEGQDDKKPARD